MVRRLWIAASLSLLAGFGCHAGPQPKLATKEAPITISDVSAARFITQHNQRALAVRSLKAFPSVILIGEDGERTSRGHAEGRLSLQRDKDFRLQLRVVTHQVADIGSNDQGFWFWVDNDPSKAIYVCDHKELTDLAVTLQPDWITEAMGLRQFTEHEARTVSAKSGATPGTLVLTQLRTDSQGRTFTKETIVNEAKGTILEHRLWAGAKTELLASAVITSYLEKPISVALKAGASTDADELAPSSSPLVVYIPEKFRLNWIKEKFAIDIQIKSLTVNPVFDEQQQVALFSEPPIPGTKRVDLAQLQRDPDTVPASAKVYQSRPIPKSGIELGTPQPSAIRGGNKLRRAIDPLPLTPDLSSTPAQPAGVIGAVVPSGSDTSPDRNVATGALRFPTVGR